MVTVFSGTSVISFRESMQITIIPCSCRAKPKDSISFPETPKVLESNTTAMWPVSNKRRSNIPESSLTEESSFPEGNGTGTAGEEAAETGEPGAARETPGRFGPGGRVRLLRADHRRLVETYGESAVSSCVRRMDEWQHYRDPLSTLEKWLQSDAQERAQAERERAPAAPAYLGKRTGAHNFSQREYTDAELEALLYTDLDELGKG